MPTSTSTSDPGNNGPKGPDHPIDPSKYFIFSHFFKHEISNLPIRGTASSSHCWTCTAVLCFLRSDNVSLQNRCSSDWAIADTDKQPTENKPPLSDQVPDMLWGLGCEENGRYSED